MRRRRLLGVTLALVGVGGCISDPGQRCPGATIRLTLRPADPIEDPLVLDSTTLSEAGNTVVETAIGGEHTENCVVWDGTPGPSAGLREVAKRIETHLGVDFSERNDPVETAVRRDGESYRLGLIKEG